MPPRLSTFAAILTLLGAGAAQAQGGPMSVGLSTDPASRSLHCGAAIFAEKYLVEEENFSSPFDRAALDAGARAWVEDAARRAGQAPGDFIQGGVFTAVSESKLGGHVQRQAQVRWCLARTPPG